MNNLTKRENIFYGCVAMAILFGIMSWQGYRSAINSISVSYWPKAEGVVETCDVYHNERPYNPNNFQKEKGPTFDYGRGRRLWKTYHWRCHLTYQYKVYFKTSGLQIYSGSDDWQGGSWHSTKSFYKQHKPGMAITVCFYPLSPGQSIIEPSENLKSTGTTMMLCFGACTLFFIVLGLFSLYGPMKEDKPSENPEIPT